MGRLVRSRMHAKRVMSDVSGIEQLFSAAMTLVERATKDRVTPVYFATIDLLGVIIESGLPDDRALVRQSPLPPNLDCLPSTT